MIKIINLLFAILSIVISGLAIFYSIMDEKNKEKDYALKMNSKRYNLLLVTIFVIGLLIRLWQFGVIPGGFNQDGAMAAVDGLALANYGTDRFGTWMPAHLYAWGYSQMSSLLSYFIAIFIKIFGFSTIVARLPQLLASIIGGMFFYGFMKDTFDKRIGLLAAFFVAINPWHFMQSRWALEANLLPHFFMGGLYFINRGLKNKKRYIYISMIFFGFSMYCYGISIYTIPFFLVISAIYYLLKKKLNIKDILISIMIYLLISWPFFLTMMVNYFKWNTIELPFVTIQYFKDSIRANDILFFSNDILRQLNINFVAFLKIILQEKNLLWNDISGFGTIYYFTLPFVVAGVCSFSEIEANGNKSLIILALITGIWVGLVTNYVNVNRMNIIYYILMMLAVIGIYQVMIKVKYTKLIIPFMYAIIGLLLINTYFTSYAKEISKAFYIGFGESLMKAEAANTAKIYITSDVQGEDIVDTSEILTLFYDKMDAKYFQGMTNINNGKLYLPYNERYYYLSITQDIVDITKNEDAAYVIRNDDRQYFNDDYEITEYNDFCAVIKK